MKKKKWMILPIVLLAIAGFSAIVMLLWNAILPSVLHVTVIDFWQAMGILVLSKILFGGFRGGGGGFRGSMHNKAKWKAMQEKMAAMTPEEREQFKSEWRSRCGWGRQKNNPSPENFG